MFDVTPLDDALRATYAADEHMVSYVLRLDGAPIGRQPRVQKGSLDWLRAQGYTVTCDVFLSDADNVGHAPWADGALERVRDALPTLLPTVGYYATSHGLRVVQPISYAMPADLFEQALGEWLVSLEPVLSQLGLVVDFACRDWTRYMRLPNVVRAGAPYRSPLIDLSRMVAVEPPKVTETPAKRQARARRAASAIAFATELPGDLAGLDAMLDALAAPIRDNYPKTRHALFMALAGAMLNHGLTAEQLPVVLAELANRSGANASDATAIGRDTAYRHAAGVPVTGMGNLRHAWPLVAEALAPFLVEPPAPPVPAQTLDEATTAMRSAIANAPDGVTCIQAACGLGKTRAAEDVAIARAAKGTPLDSRAPLQSKTAISVPRHDLARQVVEHLEARGAKVRRLFGIASLGVCQFEDQAKSLSRGGLSVAQLLCEGGGKSRCEFAETCTAYGGSEGADDARIIVGPHQLLNRLDREVGTTGLLVIDEPPSAIETKKITVKNIEHARSSLSRFEPRFAAAMAPALLAVEHWIEHLAPVGESHPLTACLASGVDPQLLLEAYDATGADDVVEAVRRAFDPDHNGTSPPVRATWVGQLRTTWSGKAEAKRIGQASEILDMVRRAMVGLSSATVVGAGENRALHLTLIDDRFTKTAQRQGAVVLLDANIDDHVPLLSKVLAYEPRVHRFAAADGAPIERAWGETDELSRRAIASDAEAITRFVKRAAEWLAEVPANGVGVVTYSQIEQRVKDEMETMLGYSIATMHFGAIRGLDTWKDFDAVITIGDPRPNLGISQQECDLFDLDWDKAVRTKATGELEQAHGRLRTIHRTKPGRSAHFGALMPGGWRVESVRRLTHAPGPAKRDGGIAPEEIRARAIALGGIAFAAGVWGVAPRTLIRYCTGERAAPPGFPPEIQL